MSSIPLRAFDFHMFCENKIRNDLTQSGFINKINNTEAGFDEMTWL